MTCIPDRTSLQASFYTARFVRPQQLRSTKNTALPSYDQIFTQISRYNFSAVNSYLEPSNLNCQGSLSNFPAMEVPDLYLPFTHIGRAAKP